MEIVRSQRRSLCLEVSRGGKVTLRVPYGASDEEIENFLKQHEKWLAKKVSEMKSLKTKELSDGEIRALKEKAKTILPEKVRYWSGVMGLKPQSVKITSAKHRFGSCSSRGNICFSYMLMLYGDRETDYVVVHELAHLKHHNHSKSFYDLVEKYVPDYREIQKNLRG